jgi:hypothetical protein
MNQPKYQIGDRIPLSPFVVRGIAPQSNGDHTYFLQILGSDNTFVAKLDQIDNAISHVETRLMSIARERRSKHD